MREFLGSQFVGFAVGIVFTLLVSRFASIPIRPPVEPPPTPFCERFRVAAIKLLTADQLEEANGDAMTMDGAPGFPIPPANSP